MKTIELSNRQILKGYDAVTAIYANIPPLSHWRAWEYAAYQNYRLKGKVLDLGCGDGKYFRLLWPNLNNVVGVDHDLSVAELSRKSGVYRSVHVGPAHKVPEQDSSFDHVFANCSLEHMDDLDLVIAEIFRCLKPGGSLLCSVVTNRFIDWSLLPKAVASTGNVAIAETLQRDFLTYHHLSNPLSVDEWITRFSYAGLSVIEHYPILPKNNGIAWLMMDSVWHLKEAAGPEFGSKIYSYLSKNTSFSKAYRKIFQGLLEMETDRRDGCGAVFFLRKAR